MSALASELYPWLVAAAGGFLGALLLLPTKLAEIAIKGRIDRILDASKAEQSHKLEQLKNDLKSRDGEISSIRNLALSGLSTRTEVLTKRRLQAVEVIWAAVLEYRRYKPLIEMARNIKMRQAMESAANSGSEGGEIRQFAKKLIDINKIDELKFEALADREQIFVSSEIWARFSVYRSVMTLPVTKLIAMREGMEPTLIKDQQPLLLAAKSVLPHMTSFIDQYGEEGLSYLHDLFEEEVLRAIVVGFSDTAADANNLRQATSIIENVGLAMTDKTKAAMDGLKVPGSIRHSEAPTLVRP